MIDYSYGIYLALAIVGFILILVILSSIYKEPYTSGFKVKVYKQLNEIKAVLNNGNSFSNRDVIIRLDSILSKVLQKHFNNDLSCGDNIKKIKHKFHKETYQDLWYYHKLRNQIVHESVDVTSDDVKKAYKVYWRVIYKMLSNS
ncbi:MAG TPA: hypothetical protein VHA74_01540 [Candidatus Dojkabacteria bacterium]|nr:hypothetical protein [Candidatus Dojkabacteria bacterium]